MATSPKGLRIAKRIRTVRGEGQQLPTLLTYAGVAGRCEQAGRVVAIPYEAVMPQGQVSIALGSAMSMSARRIQNGPRWPTAEVRARTKCVMPRVAARGDQDMQGP